MAKEYKSTWQEREERLERNKSKVNKSKNDFFNSSAPELSNIWEQYDCEKCYSRFDCKYKGQGLTHVCSNLFKDSSEHDAKVRNSAIDEFREKIMDINTTIAFERYVNGIYDLEELMIDGSREIAEQLKEQNK